MNFAIDNVITVILKKLFTISSLHDKVQKVAMGSEQQPRLLQGKTGDLGFLKYKLSFSKGR